MGAAQYKRECEVRSQTPVKIEHSSALVVSREDAIDDLDGKIAKFQQEQQKNSGSLAERIAAKKTQIQADNQQANERAEILRQARLSAADNLGVEDGIEIYQRYKAAREATFAHLQAEDL